MAKSGVQRSPQKQLGWYMVGQATWFSSIGLQFVLFPILVTNVLNETGTRLGIAQVALSLPALLFMLLGGATADRGDPRTILFRIHLFAALPPLALASALNLDFLSFELLVAYGLCMGTATAFAMPARDATLTRVAGSNVQKAVTLALAVQQTTQLAGMSLAIFASKVGFALLFAIQSLVILGGGLAARQLPKKAGDDIVHPSRLQAMKDGLTYVLKSDVLAPVIAAMFAVGVFYVGAILVLFPLIVRDFYPGDDALELGIANIFFWGATIISTLFLLRFGHVARRGRGVMIALFLGVLVVFGYTFEPPYWTFCLLAFAWGLGAGCVMVLGRTIVQSEADDAFRGRALSIFQLGFAGGSPLGSLIMGVLADLIGPHNTMWFSVIGMTLVLAWLMLKSRLWTLHAQEAT
jgi:MFS family permease